MTATCDCRMGIYYAFLVFSAEVTKKRELDDSLVGNPELHSKTI